LFAKKKNCLNLGTANTIRPVYQLAHSLFCRSLDAASDS
jgi:hypothetical protein